MYDGQRLVSLIVLGGAILPALLGCAPKAAVMTPAQTKQNQEVLQKNHQTVEQFLTALQGVPQGERVGYLQAHPAEAKLIVATDDPALRAQFQRMMSEQ